MKNSLNLTIEQKKVIDVKKRDVLVSASAGSGKTFVVVERIINRVINDNIDIDRILVVTFTNAAASELKERIVNRFYDLIKDKDITESKKKHIVRQLTLINRAQISTIHSFCLNVIKNNFYNLDIDADVRTLDENKAKLLIMESIDEVIEKEYEKKSEIFEEILEVFKTEENVISTINNLYAFSKSMKDPHKWLEDSLGRYIFTDNIEDLSDIDFGMNIIEIIKERLELLENEIQNVCDKVRDDKDFEKRLVVLEDIIQKINNVKSLKKYDDIYEYVKNNMEILRLPSSKCANETLKNEVADVKKKCTVEIENIKKMVYRSTNDILEDLKSVYDIVKWFVEAVMLLDEIYTDKKRKSGQIDFNDYEHLALKALENEDICKEYISKYEDIYIDEYQDTSYLQEAITEKISRNNRMMVGDVKQSIYSFRNAEPKLFNEKYALYNSYIEGNDENYPVKIILSKNFRSRKEILDGINDIFSVIMSQKMGECDYTNTEYLVYGEGYDIQKEIDYTPEINIIETENKEEEIEDELLDELEEITDAEKEAYEIANKINSILEQNMKVYDLKKKEYRKAEYKDIVILLRSVASKASIYEEILKSKNIPVFCDTSDAFYNGEEVGIILSLLKVVDNIYDDISLVSIMYSIIGQFSVDELTYIREYNKKCYFYDSIMAAYNDEKNVNTKLYYKIQNLLKLIDKLKIYLNTYAIAETLLKIYDETGIYYSFYLEELGRKKCANLDSLVELAKNFERDEKPSLYEFINYIEIMKDKKTKGNDSPKLLGEGENVVRILTIHKSKGLEYPIVFLANTSKKYNLKDTNKDILLDEDLGIGMDIYNKDLGISYPSIIKMAIKGRIKDRTLSEEERLLYVAMTRAKEKLYVYGTVNSYDKFLNNLSMQIGEKPSPVIVKSCNSFLKLLVLAVNISRSNNFRINIIPFKENIKSISMNSKDDIDRNISIKDKFLNWCKSKKIEENKDNSYIFDKKYNYISSSNIKKKYSVTEIKKENTEKDEIYLLDDKDAKIEYEKIKPKVIDNDNLSGASYGTIIHNILEKIDYNSLNKENINKIIDLEFANIKNININTIKQKINKYLNSDVMVYVNNAVNIQKEKPFVIYDNLEEIESYSFSENSYIQGVIDLLITTKDNKKVIIDFKTDKVEDEKELIDRYKIQLEIYKKGVEIATDSTVNGTYIYSFYLDKLIKVDA